MSENIVAKRYAEALVQLGEEKNITNDLKEEFRVVKQIFDENEKLNAFLKHPRVSKTRKNEFIDKVFQGFSKECLNTLKLLSEKNRLQFTSSIIDHFTGIVNEKNGIAEATVYSVRELSNEEQVQLRKAFSKRFNKKDVQLTNKIDPSILGGIKVRLGNTILDGSVSGKLKRIERGIVTAN